MSENTRGGPGTAGIFDFERFGDRTAVLCQDGSALSFAALAAAADAIATGFGPERSLVLIEATNALPPLLAYLGAMRAGHVALLVSAETPSDRIAVLIETYRFNAGFRSEGGAWRSWKTGAPAPALHADLTLLLSTSGSTGASKLVRLSHEAVAANAASIANYLEIADDDRALTTLPFHYSYGLSVVHSHLLRGAALLLTDGSVVDPAVRRFAEEAQVTSLAGVPYTYELLERVGFRDTAPASLRTMTQAGGRLPAEVARDYAEWAARAGVRFFVMYGQTEATARMAYMPPAQLADFPDCIGVAIPGGEFSLLDADGAIISKEEAPGELVYHGSNVMMGYARDVADLARPQMIAALRTGDIAQRNTAGLYRIVGRLSRFIKPLGVRIGLDEVEAMLRRRGIAAAATGDDHLLAVLLVEQCAVGTEEQREWLSIALKLPLASIDVAGASALPLLASGKVDYAAILTAARERVAAREERQAQDDSVERLFQDAFPRQPCPPDASFASLGGDSLNYVMLSMGLERLLGRLPPRWEKLSVAELTALVPGAPVVRHWWQVRWIDSEMLIRAVTILAVVINHASSRWEVGGGANVLLMLFGFNLSRYQFERLGTGRGPAVLRDFALRIILPYYVLLLLWSGMKGVDWPSLLLVSNYVGRFGSLLEPFWFLEVLLQIMLLLTLGFALAPVRVASVSGGGGVGLAMLVGGLVLALALNVLLPRPELHYRTPELLFWLVGLGWCIHRAEHLTQRLALALVVMGVLFVGYSHPFGAELGYPDGRASRFWLALSCFMILFVPRLPIPTILAGCIAAIAAASFYIYLTHNLPIHVALYVMHKGSEWLVVPLAIVPGLALSWLLSTSRARRAGRSVIAWSGETLRRRQANRNIAGLPVVNDSVE